MNPTYYGVLNTKKKELQEVWFGNTALIRIFPRKESAERSRQAIVRNRGMDEDVLTVVELVQVGGDSS